MSIFSKIADGIKTVTTIIPAAMETAKQFEIPEAAGQGSAKKEAAIAVIKLVLPDPVEAAIGGDKTIELIAGILDIVVKFFNAVGVFKK